MIGLFVVCSYDTGIGSGKGMFDFSLKKGTFTHWNRQSYSSKNTGIVKSKMRRALSEFIITEKNYNSRPTNNICEFIMNNDVGAIEHVLPCFDSHQDAIKRISPETMTKIIDGHFAHIAKKIITIDCRYPYEYHGGHIPGAQNICSLEDIDRLLFSSELSGPQSTVIIFHCEFSSERAPRMALHVRNLDRHLNSERYPLLFYPQLYILDGGYKNYFAQYPMLCEPVGQYVPMRNSEYRDELKFHQRIKFTDCRLNGKHRGKLRSCSLRKAHSIAMPHPTMAISTFLREREVNGKGMMGVTTTAAMLSSDIGDVMDQADSFLQAAESVLLSYDTTCSQFCCENDGRASK